MSVCRVDMSATRVVSDVRWEELWYKVLEGRDLRDNTELLGTLAPDNNVSVKENDDRNTEAYEINFEKAYSFFDDTLIMSKYYLLFFYDKTQNIVINKSIATNHIHV